VSELGDDLSIDVIELADDLIIDVSTLADYLIIEVSALANIDQCLIDISEIVDEPFSPLPTNSIPYMTSCRKDRSTSS
jgi:hypothetical protein